VKKLLLSVALATLACLAPAATNKSAKRAPAKAAVQGPVQTAHRRSPYVGAIVVNAETGEVIREDNADREAYPASVTKLMTLLLVAEDVKAGKYAFSDVVTATPDVYKSEASWVGLKVGDQMSVRDLCMALMVESANDAAIALGVHSAGSFAAFVARMNARAAELGMKNTRYYNPNGLPPKAKYPWKSFNVSTARDQMLLARALMARPEILMFTSVKTCSLVKTPRGYRVAVTLRTNEPYCEPKLAPGEALVKHLKNHNNVMRTDKLKIINPDGKEAVDGLKTGYIDAGGSSVVLTGKRNGKRVIVVVLGSSTSKERDAQARKMLSDALDTLVW